VHGHLDVVPADPAAWSAHPFTGEIRDGAVWGRGAVDMKNALAVVLAVVRGWSRAGRQPSRDIVLAFTADEEDTAEYGAQWLVERQPELFEGCTEAIGESGGYTFRAGPRLRLYPVASAERGTAWLRLTARGRAGHGSKPNPENAVTRLAAAMARIGAYQWPVRLTPTVRAAVGAIAAAVADDLAAAEPAPVTTPGSAAAADPVSAAELLAPLGLAATADPESAAELLAPLGPAGALVAGTIRNSAAPTMLSAGGKVNVIPGEAVGYVDGRVLPGYADEFRATLDELTGPDVTWEYLHDSPPVEAPPDGPLVAAMTAALLAEDPGGIVVPYCMSGGTDAKQFARLGIRCYGFTPLVLPPGYDYGAMFHGVDERVPVTALHSAVRIMDMLLASAPG
jgi:acetylornithine deacetylase/succinyl-diaminopimelate desuccinylase-like protein